MAMQAAKAVSKVFRQSHDEPFRWGTADCLMFAADVAAAITGTDPVARLRGRYTTAIGAQRILRREGWGDVAGLAAALWTEVPVAHAQIGDWAIVDGADGKPALGVVAGDRVIARGPDGLGSAPLSTARRMFRVAGGRP